MASRSAQTKKNPVQVRLSDGSLFTCVCGSKEFRSSIDEAPLHLFCQCGQIYTSKDFPPLEDSNDA